MYILGTYHPPSPQKINYAWKKENKKEDNKCRLGDRVTIPLAISLEELVPKLDLERKDYVKWPRRMDEGLKERRE